MATSASMAIHKALMRLPFIEELLSLMHSVLLGQVILSSMHHSRLPLNVIYTVGSSGAASRQ